MKTLLRQVSRAVLAPLGMALFCAVATARPAQNIELFDDTVLRTIDMVIVDGNGNPIANYWPQLVANWNGSGANMTANFSIDGPDLAAPITISGVGIRIKGNSSFFFLPPGSRKASFNLEIDYTDPTASLGGYETINLNNGIEDPTFCREIGYYRHIRRYTPAGLGNHVQLTINGDDFGVYVSLQQYNKSLLEEYLMDGGGVRHKCPNIGGAALRWFGATISSYFSAYELKDDGGLGVTAAWVKLVEACSALNNLPLTSPELIDDRFSIDSAIWTVVAENLFMDEDSYISKGADFNVYWDPTHGQSHLHQHDGNESWGVSFFGWPGGTTSMLSPTYRFNTSARPVMDRIGRVQAWRARYFAHYRTMLEDFSWQDYEQQFFAYRDLIDAAVLADPQKLYTYAQFQSNFLTDTTISVGGSATVAPGLRRYVDERRAFLLSNLEMMDPAPEIDWVRHAPFRPVAGQAVMVSAKVRGPVAAIGEVLLYYRKAGSFDSIAMMPSGPAGSNTFAVMLPLTLNDGEIVEYYVGAQTDFFSGGAMRFMPKYAEGKPFDIRVGFGSSGMRFTEVMYSAGSGEYAELTNTSGAAIDLTGWSFDDSSGEAGVLDLSAAGVVMPGESIIITDAVAATFASDWGLTGVSIIGDNTVAKLGRNDILHVFDNTGALVDRLAFGDERFEYSVRSKDESAYLCTETLGQDDVYGLRESAVGDVQNSFAATSGDIGSPGSFVAGVCGDLEFGTSYCSSPPNSSGAEGQIIAVGSPVIGAQNFNLRATQLPLNQFGFFLVSRTQGMLILPGMSQGTLCLGGAIGRLNQSIGNSGTTGEITSMVDLFQIPQPGVVGGVAAQAGESWNFQCWHRESTPMGSSNFTFGLEVVFQ